MLNCKSKIKKHFDSLEKPYSFQSNWIWKFFRNREKQLFIQFVKNLDKNLCLDLGAGSCEYSGILLKMGAKKAICVDFSPHIMSVNQDPRIEQVISDVEKFNTNNKYDLILCLGILEFLEKPERFLLGLKNFLKPQGKVIILLPLSFIGALIYSLFYLLKGILISPLNFKQLNQFLLKNDFQLEKTASASFFSGLSIYSECAVKRILFLVNGYGLGNSTRVHSIIQHIDQKFKIDIFGYGNSVEYFKQVSQAQNIFQSFPLEYGLKKGKIDILKTAGKLFQNFKAIYKSREKLKEILQFQTYSLIVADSNFSTVFLKNRPKLISINNADRIIKSAVKIKKRFYLASWLIEWADFIYNSIVPDTVISPFFEPLDSKTHKKAKFKHTALMVRKEFLNSQSASSPTRHHVLIVPSGASINTNLSLKHEKADYDISIIGEKITSLGEIKKHGKVFNTSYLMKQATIVVVNGGLSSISEALAMAKPMIVIPVKGHLEQKINADWIQEHNLGLVSSWEQLKESILEMIKNYDSFKNRLIEYKFINGAQQVADLILREVENETLR